MEKIIIQTGRLCVHAKLNKSKMDRAASFCGARISVIKAASVEKI
ncbi:MAG: hypothetical protein NTX32_06495 [Candidatus Firestonebacteria bacterium]|nr:hypothetical protein [Candidatus Firestonebacteria bacterium]